MQILKLQLAYIFLCLTLFVWRIIEICKIFILPNRRKIYKRSLKYQSFESISTLVLNIRAINEGLRSLENFFAKFSFVNHLNCDLSYMDIRVIWVIGQACITSRPRMFMRIYISMNVTKETKFRWKFLSHLEYHNKYFEYNTVYL